MFSGLIIEALPCCQIICQATTDLLSDVISLTFLYKLFKSTSYNITSKIRCSCQGPDKITRTISFIFQLMIMYLLVHVLFLLDLYVCFLFISSQSVMKC